MAVIGKIRSYSGLLIAVIGIALVAFVLGDFMGYGPAGTRETEVASVGNTKIMYQEFENRVAQQTEQWKQQTGNQSLSSAEAFQVRQQVYNQMIREIVMNREFEEIGISVSGDELTDLIIGNDPHPSIIQSFTNPQDGSFDPQTVVEFIQNMDMMEPEMQNQWIQLEDYIKQETKESKFHNLISKGFYAPDTIAFLDHQFKNTTATVNLLVKRYNTIADSLVNVSDSDLRRVYDEHKYQFENDEETRDLEYVVFPVFPSEDDREIIKQEIETLKQEMLEAEDKISFINANSDQRFDPTFYSQDELSPEIDSIMFNSEPGEVYGPYEEEDSYVVALLNDIQFRPDSMQASHILIAYVGSQSAGEETVLTREQAEETADSLLAVVRQNPGSFAQIASEMSDDPSAEMNQGDLGWFQDGDMVAPFNDAVINTPVNQFTIAESDFGFHVIRVRDKSNPAKKVQVAKLTRNIEYSNQTYQRIYSQASSFAASLREGKDFDTAAEENEVSKRIADDLKQMDNSIPGLQEPRTIIQWAFAEDTRKGDYSQIFDLNGRFVVAQVVNISPEGIPPLDNIEEDIREIALREAKAEMIRQQIDESGATSLDEIAAELELETTNVENIQFTMNNLQGFGAEPKVIGAIFALEENTVSEPINGNAGVFVFEVLSKEYTPPAQIAAQKTQFQGNFRNRVPNEAFNALQKNADIDDNRHRFY